MNGDRSTFLGGSDAPAVLGLSRWQTPLELWAEKTGQVQHTDQEQLYQKLGKRLEEVVAELFTEATGKKVHRVNETRFHPAYPFLGANIDRRVIGEESILECKTCSAWKAKEWEGEEIPREYIIQVFHYLAVTGAKKAYIAVLIGNQDFKWKVIERDDKVLKDMVAKEVAFWNDFIVPKVMPHQITKNDGDVLYSLYPVADPESIINLDDDADKLIESRNALIVDKINLEGLIEKQENEIKALLAEKETGITNHFRVTWKNQVQNRLDTSTLKKAVPDVYAQYVKEIEMRRLLIKPLKENSNGQHR